MTSTAFLEREVRARIGLSLDQFVRRVNTVEIDWDHPEAFSLVGLVGVGDGSPIATGRNGIAGQRSVAHGFADHLNAVLNRTVSDARLSLIARPQSPARCLIACVR